MSNPFKKVFKAVKKVFKAVTKIVKKILPVVAVAAAVYFGGYALANGTLTGSGTHLSSLITGNAGAGSSLFVPGANSAASQMMAKAGMQVGQGWLGGSGFPGMGTKEGIATINTTTARTTAAFNTEVASNYAMTESVDAAGNFTDLGAGANYTAPTANQAGQVTVADMSGAAPAEFPAASGRPTPIVTASDPYTAQLTGTPPPTGGSFRTDLAAQAGVDPNAMTNASSQGLLNGGSGFGTHAAPDPMTFVKPAPNVGASMNTALNTPMASGAELSFQEQYFKNKLLADQAAKTAAANAPWYSKAWSGLGDYGKMAAIQTGGQMVSGYFQGEAEEEKLAQKKAEEQAGRDRWNAQTFGTYTYVPGYGIRYTTA